MKKEHRTAKGWDAGCCCDRSANTPWTWDYIVNVIKIRVPSEILTSSKSLTQLHTRFVLYNVYQSHAAEKNTLTDWFDEQVEQTLDGKFHNTWWSSNARRAPTITEEKDLLLCKLSLLSSSLQSKRYTDVQEDFHCSPSNNILSIHSLCSCLQTASWCPPCKWVGPSSSMWQFIKVFSLKKWRG